MRFIPFILIFLLISLAKSAQPAEPGAEIIKAMCEKEVLRGETYYRCYADPKKVVNIFGTDYVKGEDQQVYLQLLHQGQPVNNATCQITIWHPNNIALLRNVSLNFLEEGIYYIRTNFRDEGIYKLIVYCAYTMFREIYPFSNYTILNGTDSYPSFLETSGTDRLDIIFRVNVPTLNASTTLVSTIVSAKWNMNNENLGIFLYDFSTRTWVQINTITYSVSPVDYINTFSFTDFLSRFYSGGNIYIRISDFLAATGRGSLTFEAVSVKFEGAASAYINEIRGGGEIHISPIQHVEIATDKIIKTIFASNELKKAEFPILDVLILLLLFIILVKVFRFS